MRWSELDLERKIWVLPKERSKNGVAHVIPLSDRALEILKSLPRFESDFVFAGGSRAFNNFSRLKESIDAAIDPQVVVEGWTFHDLRRTCASGMAEIGVGPHVIEAVLGHTGGIIRGVARTYNRFDYVSEQRQALTAWSRKLGEIVTGEKPANVVELVKARAPA
jgi:integrase